MPALLRNSITQREIDLAILTLRHWFDGWYLHLWGIFYIKSSLPLAFEPTVKNSANKDQQKPLNQLLTLF